MHTFAQKPKATQQTTSAKSTIPGRGDLGGSPEERSVLHLQRLTGNQAVPQLLHADAKEPKVGVTGPGLPRYLRDFTRTRIQPTAAFAIQTKLAISKPGDSHEQETDFVAEQVLRTPEPQPSREHECLQAKHVQASDTGQIAAPPIVDTVLESGGQSLDAWTRDYMEPRFGYDFSRVRVHTDAKAAESARAVNALAYTVGRDVVFGAGQYKPGSAEGKLLLAHELTHTIQQAARNQTPGLVQRIPQLPLGAYIIFNLHNNLKTLADNKVTDYIQYRNAIFQSSEVEKAVVLGSPKLLTSLRDTLTNMSFTRCVEALGRRAPTFDELRKDSAVLQAIDNAWQASDVGVRDMVTQPHEEGGWIFMNLIDGSLSIERVTDKSEKYTDGLKVEPAPQVKDSVLVALFHTHPTLGPKAGPSPHDLKADKRRGVPNLVAANKGNDPKTFQIYLSGPAARNHLASDNQFPGPGGGIAP